MKHPQKASPVRREPKQSRSLQTVDAVLMAVQRVLQRHGANALTTNRIAEAAGVSIGSLYQYFPDKRAIFAALYERHVDDVRMLIERTTFEHSSATFEAFTRELVRGLTGLHSTSPELHEIVSAAVPERSQGFKTALRATFDQVLTAGDPERFKPLERDRMLFVLPPMVEALVHGVVEPRSSLMPINERSNEAVRTVLGYLSWSRSAAL